MSEGRVVLVTGGSRGIGRACVEAFAAAGYRVAACATTREGAAAGNPTHAFACDVSDKASVKRGLDEVLRHLGRLDVIVNNAGVAGENALDDDNDDVWHRIIDVNLHGTYYVSKAALPHLPDGSGRIINVGSTLSLRGVPDQTAYCAAKHAVVGFTRALALHAAPRGVTVNALCPGWTRTDMMQQRATELGARPEDLARGVPTGRVVEPEEVASLALYLASEAARSITGQTLVVDGGSLA